MDMYLEDHFDIVIRKYHLDEISLFHTLQKSDRQKPKFCAKNVPGKLSKTAEINEKHGTVANFFIIVLFI